MNKSKAKEIIKFSFFKYFQNRWFILFNILSLVSIVVSLNWSLISSVVSLPSQEDEYSVAILDNENLVFSRFMDSLSGDHFAVSKIETNDYTSENIPKNFVVLEVFKEDDLEPFKTKLISKEGISNKIYQDIYSILFKIRNEDLQNNYNISDDTISLIQSPVPVERIMLSVDASDSEFKNIVNYFASALTYLLSVIVFTRIANEISQEKSSKSSEYILTAVSEREYLFAKVFSNIAILIIQIILLLSYYLMGVGLLSAFKVQTTDISLTDAMSVSGLSQDIVIYLITLIFYNIITLILMSIVQATMAAKTTSSQEAGNTVSILVFVMAMLYMFTIAIINPYSTINPFLYGLSVLPVFSGFLVPAMMVIGQATWYQVLISILLLLFLIPRAFNYCGTIFKNGLLDYTKKKKTIFDIEPDNSLNTLLNKRTFKQIGSVIGIGITIYIGLQIIIPTIISMIIEAFLPSISQSDRFLLLQMLSQASCLGLAYWFVKTYIDKETRKSSKQLIIPKSHIIFIALTIIVVLQVILQFIYPYIGLEYKNDFVSAILTNFESPLISKIILLLSIAVTPAIFEELFFRQGIINLCEKHGKLFAVLLSALLFGLIHMNMAQFLFAFIMGLILGTIYIYTKDIRITMLIHFINNGYEALTLIVPKPEINPSYTILLNFLAITAFLVGLTELIVFLSNKEKREKLLEKAKIKLNLASFGQKYIYLFYDYIFDVSLVLLIILSCLTEKLYRGL